MEIDDLKAALDQLAWREQVEFEFGERHPGHADDAEILADIRRLGRTLRPGQLDALERSAGYAVWALRLGPSVPGDDPRARALRHHDSADPDIRYWAQRLLMDSAAP